MRQGPLLHVYVQLSCVQLSCLTSSARVLMIALCGSAWGFTADTGREVKGATSGTDFPTQLFEGVGLRAYVSNRQVRRGNRVISLFLHLLSSSFMAFCTTWTNLV
jgi:hypothetical protein